MKVVAAGLSTLLAVIAAVVVVTVRADVASTANGHFISVTDLELASFMNYMLEYPADDASTPSQNVQYPYYELTTAGAIDLVRQRYLLMIETPEVIAFNLSDPAHPQLGQLLFEPFPYPLPDVMMYDADTDTIWLVVVGASDVSFCKVTNTTEYRQVAPICVQSVAGSFSYTNDAAAYDPVNKLLYVQLQSMSDSGGQPLFVFNTNTHAVSTPIPVDDLCLNMVVAASPSAQLVCVDFVFNVLVTLDTATGQMTPITKSFLPGTPQPYTAAIVNPSAEEIALAAYEGRAAPSSLYFVELEDLFSNNRWASFDVVTGDIVHNSTVYQNYQLAMPVWIPN